MDNDWDGIRTRNLELYKEWFARVMQPKIDVASIGLRWPAVGLARPPGSSQDPGPQPAVLALTRRRRSAPKGLRPFFWGPSDADG
jgi:hypothetical protein